MSEILLEYISQHFLTNQTVGFSYGVNIYYDLKHLFNQKMVTSGMMCCRESTLGLPWP